MSEGLIVFLVITTGLGLATAYIAQSKGRGFGWWWLYGTVLPVVGLVHALTLKVVRPSLAQSLTDLGMDDTTAAQASTREGLRRLAEDAGVATESTGAGWRPVRFEELPASDRQDQPRTDPATDPATSGSSAPTGLPERWIRVGQVFSPAAPVNRQDLFAGRHGQMEALIDAAFERGQHAVVFGERGVGKTSLATIMTMVLGAGGSKLAVKVNCDATDTYDSLWRKIFDEFDFLASSGQALPREASSRLRGIVGSLDPDRALTPDQVRKTLRLMGNIKDSAIFVDEFERLRDRQVTTLFADTLKMMSDQLVPATIIIVGVADNIQELLAEHRSIERALVQIHMPRMSSTELGEIVRRALEQVDMKIEEPALELITSISQGLPHFTHLIAQGAARAAIDDSERSIVEKHVESALSSLVDKTQETIVEAYNTATFSNRETLYPLVLLAAAMAPSDQQGFFAAADLVVPLSTVAKKPYDIPAFSRHLHALSQVNRGPTLQRKGSEHRYRFRFANPMLQPYVLMRGLSDGTISPEDLNESTEGQKD